MKNLSDEITNFQNSDNKFIIDPDNPQNNNTQKIKRISMRNEEKNIKITKTFNIQEQIELHQKNKKLETLNFIRKLGLEEEFINKIFNETFNEKKLRNFPEYIEYSNSIKYYVNSLKVNTFLSFLYLIHVIFSSINYYKINKNQKYWKNNNKKIFKNKFFFIKHFIYFSTLISSFYFLNCKINKAKTKFKNIIKDKYFDKNLNIDTFNISKINF